MKSGNKMFKLKTKAKTFNDGGNFRDIQKTNADHSVMYVTYDRVEGGEYKDFMYSGIIIFFITSTILIVTISWTI